MTWYEALFVISLVVVSVYYDSIYTKLVSKIRRRNKDVEG